MGTQEAMDAKRAVRKRKRNTLSAVSDLLTVVDSVMDHCPWTKQTSPDQMVKHTASELREIADELAAGKERAVQLQEELGDLFFDAFLLAAQCRREYGIDVGAAAHAAAAKVKRRCPHVFGDEVATTAAEAAAIWQRVKREEHRVPAAHQ